MRPLRCLAAGALAVVAPADAAVWHYRLGTSQVRAMMAA